MEKMDENNKKMMDITNKIKKQKNTICILRHNQKKIKYLIGGIIYIMRLIDTSDKKDLKLRKTTHMDKRVMVANTSIPNNMTLMV